MRPSSILSGLAVTLFLTIVAAAQNQAPSVSINPVPTLVPPNNTVTLTATVTDDGLPSGNLTYRWCSFDGPGDAVFGTPNSAQTTAFFDVAGTYTIRLIVSDGALSTTANTTVQLNPVANLPSGVLNILNATATNGLDPLFSNRFLTAFDGLPLVNPPLPSVTAGQYYATIDPTNIKTTFNAWKIANGFGTSTLPLVQLIGQGSNPCCAAAVYGNAVDLGFGRRMVMSRQGGNVAFFVTNYPTVEDAVNDSNAFLSVCMEYSPLPGQNCNNRFTKFYTFDGSGARVGSINFDGRGIKQSPGVCMSCHGGFMLGGSTLPPGGDVQANFLPFDMSAYDFSCQPGFDRASLELAVRDLNQGVLDTNPRPAIRELIEGWYGGPTLPQPTQNDNFTPSGWNPNPGFYQQVIAKSCRSCHVSRIASSLDFDNINDIVVNAAKLSGTLVFGPTANGFRMPHAKRTFERFWLSTAPHQPAVVQQALTTALAQNTPQRLYVDHYATGANNGSSWSDALVSLTSALTLAAQQPAIKEIWLADGVYVPPTPSSGDPRTATFTIPSGVAIFGGFAGNNYAGLGGGETLLSQRDIQNQLTVLSGDRNGDDAPGFVNTSENAYHVVTLTNANDLTRLDGITISGGAADMPGELRGGGLRATTSNLTIANCTFVDNRGDEGAAIALNGGMPKVINSRFFGNLATTSGGAIDTMNAVTTVAGSIFSGNGASNAGARGGAIQASSGSLSVLDSSFSLNVATGMGGAIDLTSVTAVIANTILWQNSDGGGMGQSAQIFQDAGAPAAVVAHCVVQGGTAGTLNGSGNIFVNPTFVNAPGPDGLPGTIDDDLRLLPGSPCIDAGNNGFVVVDSADLDGDADDDELMPIDVDRQFRFFDDVMTTDTGIGNVPVVDIGAFEFPEASLLSCAAGTVGSSMGGPFDVFTVNAGNGGTRRRVDVEFNMPVTLMMNPAPGAAFSPFTLFGYLGVPGPNDARTLPLGIGTMCFTPEPLLAFRSRSFTLTDNLGLGICDRAFNSTPAPWALAVPSSGSTPLQLTMQGIIFDPTAPFGLSVTNGILLNVVEDADFPPVADAGPDQMVTTMSMVTLDGSASSDPDMTPLTFSWMQTGGTMVTLNNATSAMPTFTAPAAPDILTFELMVSDGISTATDSVTVTVVLGNVAPVANAGANQAVLTGAAVMLSGSATDQNGDPVTFSWQQLSGFSVTLNGANTATPTFTAPTASQLASQANPLGASSLTFRLTATDPTMLSSTDDVTITVRISYAGDIHPIYSTAPNLLNSCSGGTGAGSTCTSGVVINTALVCTDCHSGMFPAAGLTLTGSAAATFTAISSRINTSVPALGGFPARPSTQGAMTLPAGSVMFEVGSDFYRRSILWIQQGALNN